MTQIQIDLTPDEIEILLDLLKMRVDDVREEWACAYGLGIGESHQPVQAAEVKKYTQKYIDLADKIRR